MHTYPMIKNRHGPNNQDVFGIIPLNYDYTPEQNDKVHDEFIAYYIYRGRGKRKTRRN